MKPWMQSVTMGAAVLVVASLLACRSGARLGEPQTHEVETKLWAPDPRAPLVAARIEAKGRVADDVLAGRMSLLEGAAAYRDLDAQEPPCDITVAYPDASSLDEARCRCVIEYVKGLTPRDRAAEGVNGLEEELSVRLRDGTLRLPGK